MATVLTEAVPEATARVQQLIGHPTLFELQQHGSFVAKASELITEQVGVDERQWAELEDEFADVRRRLELRRESVTLRYPVTFAIEAETSLLLYALTRLVAPGFIIETSVADGISTFVFLAALAHNAEGELHSLDIAGDVGGLVDDRERWHLHVCDVKQIEDGLANLVRHAPPAGIFFHDADHRFLPQLCEYETYAAAAPEDGGALPRCRRS